MADTVRTFTGIWHNWSHGAIRGATLTLSQKDAGYLTAFLAIFVSFAGGMFWRITSFVLHQVWATNPDQGHDILHHRRQVILRNSGAGAAAWSLLMLGFGRHGSILRSLPVAIVPATVLILFGISNIFTSYVTKFPGNSTIILGPHCGDVAFNTSDATDGLTSAIMLGKGLADTYEASTYVTQCYAGSESTNCGTYVRPSIPFKSNPNASCPFESGFCVYNDNSALQMDTGLLDSHSDFGINAQPQDRVKFRRVATCAPLRMKPFVTFQNTTNEGLIVYVDAGPVSMENYTFTYNTRGAYLVDGYTLEVYGALEDTTGRFTGRQWSPDSRLNTTHADVALFMLAQNAIIFNIPCDDPWMSAHIPYNFTSLGISGYLSDYYLSLLGCVDQYQICNPNVDGDSGCSILAGAWVVSQDIMSRYKKLDLTALQLATASRFLWTAGNRNLASNVNGRGGNSLRASQTAYDNSQYYIPPNQWQIEVEGWFNTSLAKEQAWAVEWATTPKNYAPNPIGKQIWAYSPPANFITRSMCYSQLIHNSGEYESFSILGISLVIGVGGIIILIGFTIDSIVRWLQSPKAGYKADQWQKEENIQLHKAAYKGFGIWREDGLDLPPSTALQHAVPKYGDHARESLEKNASIIIISSSVQDHMSFHAV